jgi:23S rRNA pseudouridine1911/1915/1917 synthase
MLIAKNNRSHQNLSSQFAQRQVKKTYHAIVKGVIKEEKGLIQGAISRSRSDRMKMEVSFFEGKEATTEFEVLERFNNFTHVLCMPKTGRTHQIRVHFSFIGHPLLGDGIYGNPGLTSEFNGSEIELLPGRHMLHADSISFFHPKDNKTRKFSIDLPEDMKTILAYLQKV